MCWKVIGGRHHRPICWALKQPQTHPEPTIATAYSNPTVVQTRWFWDMDTVNQLQIVVVILTLHNQAKFYHKFMPILWVNPPCKPCNNGTNVKVSGLAPTIKLRTYLASTVKPGWGGGPNRLSWKLTYHELASQRGKARLDLGRSKNPP